MKLVDEIFFKGKTEPKLEDLLQYSVNGFGFTEMANSDGYKAPIMTLIKNSNGYELRAEVLLQRDKWTLKFTEVQTQDLSLPHFIQYKAGRGFKSIERKYPWLAQEINDMCEDLFDRGICEYTTVHISTIKGDA